MKKDMKTAGILLRAVLLVKKRLLRRSASYVIRILGDRGNRFLYGIYIAAFIRRNNVKSFLTYFLQHDFHDSGKSLYDNCLSVLSYFL